MSLLGDLMIIPGMWALMGQFPRVEPMPLALYAYLQSVHPVWIILLPIRLALVIVGRGTQYRTEHVTKSVQAYQQFFYLVVLSKVSPVLLLAYYYTTA